jgi:hypothetical protein
VTLQNLPEYLGGLYRALDNFWKLIGKEVRTSTTARGLLYLHKKGRLLNEQLFGKRRDKVEDFVKTTCPTWQQSVQEGYVPPLIEVTTRLDSTLPFEFLPLFDTTVPKIDERSDETLTRDLLQLAARFPGFSTVINRIFTQYAPNASAGIIENIPRMGIRFFHHAGLIGAQREREFFSGAEWIDLRGPWPEQLLNHDNFVSDLAKQLWNGSDARTTNESIDQIQHFACHCDTEQDHSEYYALHLAHRKDWVSFLTSSVRRVTIGDLGSEIGSYDEKRDPNCSYPIVFLNACGSSKFTPDGVASFPKLFLGLEGSRGVIGTETTIPDSFAAAFSKRFYLNLIQGYTLGESLFRARWSLLKHYKNPLGILYTVYANPDLRVRRPLPSKADAPGS